MWRMKTTMPSAASSDEDLLAYLGNVAAELPRDAATAAELAGVLAASGTVLSFPGAQTADVASTGGPSSLSTLLCPLFLGAAGLQVPKLGVPGRPAGGIDCLAQVQGYASTFTENDLREVLLRCGYAHFVASGRFAPLDARLFRLRQLHGFQEVPTLVAASLLSKKLAVGVRTAGLDVRVAPHGNFGRNLEEAGLNARMYQDAAGLVGVAGRPVLTDGSLPYQPYIGRAEALAAMSSVFDGSAGPWLQEHVELCRKLSSAAAPDQSAAIEAVTVEDLHRVFVANLAAQGATEAAFLAAAGKVVKSTIRPIQAAADGVVEVSLEQVRRALVAAQGAVNDGREYPDPVGVILCKRPGERVNRGEILATVRIDAGAPAEDVVSQLKRAIGLGSRVLGA